MFGTERGEQELRALTWRRFYEPYLAGLQNAGFQGALIIHGLGEDEVATRKSFLREMLAWLNPKQD